MIRVLVVDDSVVVRRMLSDALSSDPRVEVVGSAANGAIALQKIAQLSPDVVILDVEMPDMDGIETVKRIRPDFPKLPVIMCSSLTEKGAEVTLRALAAGATDYIAKPTASATQADGLISFKADLIGKVLALGSFRIGRALDSDSASTGPQSIRSRPPSGRGPVSALAIGCSTGGPNALTALFAGIPADLPVPIFIVQHMPPLFTKMLAERLTASSGVSVVEARHGEAIEPGRAYIAPGDHHLVAGRLGARAVTLLNQDAPENSCRPAVDVLFRSLAAVYGSGVLACVLTGMGHDGARGAGDIVRAGGRVLVQEAKSCVVPSMPGAVIDAGFAEKSLTLERIAHEFTTRVRATASIVPGVSLQLQRKS